MNHLAAAALHCDNLLLLRCGASVALSPLEVLGITVSIVNRQKVWDNPGGGTAGDGTVLLSRLIAAGATNVGFSSCWDPQAVQLCGAAGVGGTFQVHSAACGRACKRDHALT